MKNLILFVAFLLSANLAHAGTTPEYTAEKCRNEVTNLPVTLSPSQRVEADLLTGVWTEEYVKGEAKTVFQFHDFGLVDMIVINDMGQATYENHLWRTDQKNGQGYLVITDQKMENESYYRVEATCHGAVLVNIETNEEVYLSYAPKKSRDKLDNSRMILNGSWSSATYPYDLTDKYEACGTFEKINGAFLNYEFNANGTYVKSFGSDQIKLQEKGFYEISKDGKYLLFYATPDGKPEHTSQVSVARIQYLSMGEMVLELELTTQEKDFADFFCSEMKTIAFIQ